MRSLSAFIPLDFRDMWFLCAKFLYNTCVLLDWVIVVAKGLSLSSMERLLRVSTGLRISENATKALKDEMERYAEEIAEKAARYAPHAGRRTIKAEDIKLVVKGS